MSSKRQQQAPGFRANLREYFNEYSNNTGIHGCKYIGEKNTSLFERCAWLSFVFVSLYLCASLIKTTWDTWESSPVIVSFATSPTPVWKIPFPAVTICPEMKIKQSSYNFTEALRKFEDGEEAGGLFFDSTLVCDRKFYKNEEKMTDFNAIERLLSLGPPLDEVFVDCQWATQTVKCEELFFPVLTEDGMCFTFNMLKRSDLFNNNVFFQGIYMEHSLASNGWNLETGYSPQQHFPRRVFSAGVSAGLSITLKNNVSDFDFSCRGSTQGYKALLHDPTEMPRIRRHYLRLSLDDEVVVSVTPDMMTTSEGLRDYAPQRRDCFFVGEKKLEFFQVYTQQNCQVECLANYTKLKCGCVAYHMPHDEATKICGPGSSECVAEAEGDLLKEQAMSKISSKNSSADCSCLPACASIAYNSETSQGFYNWKRSFEARNDSPIETFPGLKLTRVSFFFNEMQFMTSERNELYGSTDFIANCGGLLGLFTGFSFLSGVEIVYFLTLRLSCNLKMFGKRYWSGSKELVQEFQNKK